MIFSVRRSILKQEPDNLRFQSREKVFEDEATVGDQEIENDDIVYCTFRRGEGDSWEEIDITAPAGEANASEGSEKK